MPPRSSSPAAAAVLLLQLLTPSEGLLGPVRVPFRPALRVSAPRLAADGDGRGGDNGDREKTTGISPAAGGVGSEGKEKSGGSAGPFSSIQQTWGQLSALWGGFQVPKLEEDDLPEAVALNAALNACKADPSAVPLKKLSAMTGDYYRASYDRIMARPAVKDGLPLIFSVANAGVVLLILRLLLPRLLAIESMNDIYEFAPELGLPSKTELLQYVEYAQNMDYTTKFLIFLLIICVEKVTLVGEFLPIGIVLPSISPVLFGGVLQGTLISAFCAAFGSSLNFILGKNFLYERVLELEVFGQPPVKNATWYRALSSSIEKDGFKSALLLRLAPVLPIPIDAHWYVAGCTPLKLPTFFCAYFVGALKATFLDAYLGSMLTSGLAGEEVVSESTRIIVVAETVAILLVSVLVTQYALGLFKEMMQEEGYDYDAKAAVGVAESALTQGTPGAGASVGSDRGVELADEAVDIPTASLASRGGAPLISRSPGAAETAAAPAAADESDTAAEEALDFVAEAQAAQAAGGARGEVSGAEAPAVSGTQRVAARMTQIAAREAEIAARLRELDASSTTGRKPGEGSI